MRTSRRLAHLEKTKWSVVVTLLLLLLIEISLYSPKISRLPPGPLQDEGSAVKTLGTYTGRDCPHPGVPRFSYLLIVRTAVEETKVRAFLRERVAYSKPICHVKILFPFGSLMADRTSKIVETEQIRYGDMLVIPSLDDVGLASDDLISVVLPWTWQCLGHVRDVIFMEVRVFDSLVFKQWTPGWGVPRADSCLSFSGHSDRLNISRFAAHVPPIGRSCQDKVHAMQSLGSGLHSQGFEYQDFLVTPHEYRELVSPFGLTDFPQHLFAVVVVHSSVNNFRNRQMVRRTWGNATIQLGLSYRLVFVIGLQQTRDVQTSKTLKEEMSMFGDLIQEDFVDTYRNNTIKNVAGLKFATQLFQKGIVFDYFIKADDDIVLDTTGVKKHLQSRGEKQTGTSRSIHCFHLNGMFYKYKLSGKHDVSDNDYPAPYYPGYCSGAAYIVTADLVPLLFDAAQHVRYFWVDDVHVTGVLPHALGNITLYQIPGQSHHLTTFRDPKGTETDMIVHMSQRIQRASYYWAMFQRRWANKNR